jgi:hypothetical protein
VKGTVIQQTRWRERERQLEEGEEEEEAARKKKSKLMGYEVDRAVFGGRGVCKALATATTKERD